MFVQQPNDKVGVTEEFSLIDGYDLSSIRTARLNNHSTNVISQCHVGRCGFPAQDSSTTKR